MRFDAAAAAVADRSNASATAPNRSIACPAMVVTMQYVPIQVWETPYDNAAALSRGTIFPSLDKPFIGEGSWAK